MIYNFKYKCNFLLKFTIIFTVIYSSIKIIPTNKIISNDIVIILLIALTSFFVINNYIK